MLIENKIAYKVGDVISFKIVGGDEVIAKLVSVDGQALHVTKPFIVAMAQQGFGLMPFMLTAADKDAVHEIPISTVISIQKTLKEVADHYIKQTTGLVMP